MTWPLPTNASCPLWAQPGAGSPSPGPTPSLLRDLDASGTIFSALQSPRLDYGDATDRATGRSPLLGTAWPVDAGFKYSYHGC